MAQDLETAQAKSREVLELIGKKKLTQEERDKVIADSVRYWTDHVNAGFLKRWSGMPRTQQFVLYKRGEIFSRQVQEEARAGKPISDYYALVEQMLKFDFEADYKQISIPTMLTANQGDEFFGDQPKQAFEFLTNVPASRKVLLNLTAAQGASLHDQPIGP